MPRSPRSVHPSRMGRVILRRLREEQAPATAYVTAPPWLVTAETLARAADVERPITAAPTSAALRFDSQHDLPRQQPAPLSELSDTPVIA